MVRQRRCHDYERVEDYGISWIDMLSRRIWDGAGLIGMVFDFGVALIILHQHSIAFSSFASW